ncbi:MULTISPECIES: endonuclease domain-containing protein [unclassified Sphingobium]|uniref:endonuclease domain-containing protein n=1 Tax=unclassified Sphingobium TaxID=2611147 RepID=UPI0022245F5B|nr:MULTISPECIES: endonuclease domain-containing protein [unclassified Sphingobium]MCW2411434.1 very-short-patch-repair endonuclease [Sphingobium sp. B8D3D]MCW2416273.1 very-short-patch-repair endonuclease [Sphingobium sp. B8D3A]
MNPDRPTMLARASRMRREPTEPERRLWQHLRASQLGHKFRRQATIDGRIVDFFCPQKGLVVEVDGQTHLPELDAVRDRQLRVNQGFSTLRFSNSDVMTNMEGVLTHLRAKLDMLPDRWQAGATPGLSSEEERRKSA